MQIGVADFAATVELTLQRPLLPGPGPNLASITRLDELPHYLREVVTAVAEGVPTSTEFAKVRGISISNASERFRLARRFGWITPADGRYLARQGLRYTLDPSKAPR
jgi:hypothetical protein